MNNFRFGGETPKYFDDWENEFAPAEPWILNIQRATVVGGAMRMRYLLSQQNPNPYLYLVDLTATQEEKAVQVIRQMQRRWDDAVFDRALWRIVRPMGEQE